MESYALEVEEKEWTLIDAGLPFSCKPILKTAEGIGKTITKIILTHARLEMYRKENKGS
ncbi:hypothetical protein [Halobacillus salinarum]|uniref:hypothetical protein n=1 Tax=Halobacillus salinarum TaxID=2932257 RepID=UPI0037C11400